MLHTNLLSVKALLNEVEKLETNDLETFAGEVLSLKARRKAPTVGKKESEILLEINRELPRNMMPRFKFLSTKRGENSLSDAEYTELLGLSDQVEKHDLERLRMLTELAEIRQVSLRDLMEQLGMKPK